jgi:TatD DNase family protein
MSKKKKTPRENPEDLGLPRVGVETHAHLDLDAFSSDLEAVLTRAKACGLAAVGNVFLGPEAFAAGRGRFCDLPAGSPEVFFVCGVHPHDASAMTGETLSGLAEAFAGEPRLKALGETGLDFHYDRSPRQTQERAFREQLALARELDTPVVVHSREAEARTLAILDEMGFKDRPLVWHCFSRGADLAREIVSRGWTASVPGTLTFDKSGVIAEGLKVLGPDRLLLETDCPFMAPHPWRGKRNEPAFLGFTARAAARVLGLEEADLWQRTGDNARAFFGLG